MQELINRLQVAFERGDKKYKPAFEYWLNEAKNLLPKEREQIVEAWDSPFFGKDGYTGVDYFNSKYNNQ